ncbi:MAG TPA: hypothetical protein VGJ21_20795 [Terracidiphilus sp.]|jgi:hypothetical protein
MDSALQAAKLNAPAIDLSFARAWQAEILPMRPLILPPRHYVYPREVEEIERGALEVMVRREGEGQPFLATCALGFRDPAAPTGIWSAPNADELCAVSGGYAYVINTAAPERFTFLPYRPVMRVLPVVECGLLLFVGHRTILAWGRAGQAWESAKLSDEGVTVTGIEGNVLRGLGWNLFSDREGPFSLDLESGAMRG